MTAEAELVKLVGAGFGGQLLLKVLGPELENQGHRLKEWLHASRTKNVDAVLSEAASMAKNLEIHAVPGRVLFPILEASANEDSPDMRQRWAALLAAAATQPPDAINASFPGILASLSPQDCVVLERMFLVARKPRQVIGKGYGVLENYPELAKDYPLIADNLARLGLIRNAMNPDALSHRMPGGVIPIMPPGQPTFEFVELTTLGDAFTTACYPPGKAESERYMFHS